MFSRLRKFSHKHSFFLFGPRGTDKSTLLKQRFNPDTCLWIDLLDSEVENRFLRHPSDIHAIVKALTKKTPYVVLDEIQKVPKLLDEVHRLVEETDKIFILTGSSARKLKNDLPPPDLINRNICHLEIQHPDKLVQSIFLIKMAGMIGKIQIDGRNQ
jgi:predicted AAA+ superfamily ATPase